MLQALCIPMVKFMTIDVTSSNFYPFHYFYCPIIKRKRI